MNTKILYATLAGGVVSFLLGWLIYGMLLAETYKSMITTIEGLERGNENMIMWAMAVSQFVWALMFALVFDLWAKISTFKGGAIGGAWLTALFVLCIDLGFYSMYTIYSLQWVLLDTLVGAVMGALVGGTIGWVLGFGKAATA